MTDDRSLERAARSFIEAGPTEAPERAVEAALLRIETTPQERGLRMPWRFRTMPFRLAVAAAIVVLAVGAAFGLDRLLIGPDRGTSALPATLAELNGPWRPEPLLVPGDVVAAAEAACRRDPDFPPNLELVIADARGTALGAPYQGVAGAQQRGYLGFYGPNGQFADCFIETFGPPAPEGWSPGTQCCGSAAVAPLELRWESRIDPALVGRVGVGIAMIRVEFDNGVTAIASRNGDWFAVYAARDRTVRYRAIGLDASGTVVKTLEDFPR